MMTRTGAGVALAGGALILGGSLTGLTDFVLVGMGCVAGLALAATWVTVSVADLDVRREVAPARLREGESAMGILHVTNRRSRSSPPLTAVEVCAGVPIEVAIPPLAPRGTDLVRYAIPPLRRGRHDVKPLRVGQSDPFRLLLRGSQQCGPSDLIVHPRVVPLRPLFTAGAVDADGSVIGNTIIQGEEFRSLRPYQAGDDPRTIHWRSSARLESHMVRVNVIPDQPRYTVVLDTSRPPYHGEKFDEAVRIAASLCDMAVAEGFPLQLTTTAGSEVTVDPARSPQGGRVRALDLLAAASADPADPGLTVLDRRLGRRTGGILVVITGRADTRSLVQLPWARRRHLITVLVRVGDERRPEADPLKVQVVAPGTAEEFAVLWNAVVRS